MSNVVELNVVTTVDIPPKKILDGAIQADLETAIVVGLDAEGELYFAGSTADAGTILWLFELAKKVLLG